MEKYQMFLPAGSSSATNYSSQMAALGFNGTTDFGGDSSTSSLDHGFLGQTGTYDNVHASVDPLEAEVEAEAEASNSGKISTEKKIKKPKYAFQTRSQVDILDDVYRWRKYGQKAVKANKFPRSYYRCTYEGCNVKKQVQRLSKDEGVVVITYEGMHTHPIDKPNN